MRCWRKIREICNVPEAETDLESLLDEGRLPGIFCRLNVERFSGLVCVEHAGETTVFTFAGGRPVLAEASTPGESVAETFLKSGLVSREHYAKIVSRMTESLVDSEDITFCREAVALGALSQAQVDEELSRRVRTKVVQAIGWEDCYVELEEDPELASRTERSGEPVGALILTGVRTFYFDKELDRELGKLKYARLTLAPETVAAFFELDANDRRLIEALDGRKPFTDIARRLGLEDFSVRQLLCALNYAGCVELASQAFAHASALDSGVMAASTEDARASEGGDTGPPPKDPLADQLRAYMDDDPGSSARAVGGRGQIGNRATQSQAERPTSYRARPDSDGVRAPQARAGAQPRTSPTPRRDPTPTGRNTSADPERDRANRKLGAIQRLGKELENRREPGQPRAAAPRGPSTALKSLVLNRRRAQAQTQNVAPRAVDAAEVFRQGMELLRAEQWGRALTLLTQAADAAPENVPGRMYMLWAAFKASAQPSDGTVNDLRLACRDQLQSDDHRGAAYYYLAHMALHAKKDEQAEKFFRKAASLDKNNKDAERHLLILERRREHAAKASKGNKMFGIELTLTRKKSDDE
jgi:hypothetical protein